MVPHCLREHASELDLTRAGRLPFGLALAPGGFFFYHRHSGSIHFYVQNRNRLAHDDRQIQLHGALNVRLLVRGDALHRLGGDFQTGE